MRFTVAALVCVCVVQSASAAERDVAVLRGSKTDEVVAPPAVPVLVRQPSRFLQQGIFFEFGARYWLSSGTFSKDLFAPQSGVLLSRLTYSGVTSHSVELFGSVKQVDALFLKWNLGFGKSVAGSLVDEDFNLPVPPFASAYSRTTSDQGDGSLGYGRNSTTQCGSVWNMCWLII